MFVKLINIEQQYDFTLHIKNLTWNKFINYTNKEKLNLIFNIINH